MIPINSTAIRNLDALSLEHYAGVEPIITDKLNNLTVPHGLKNYLELPNKLKEIITAKPLRLLELEREMVGVCRQRRITTERAWLQRIFSYRVFSNKNHNPYNAYNLAAGLNVQVCPYCNRQYTFTVISVADNMARPAFDHFFDKVRHPLLGLSFYNLIPSCHLCNSTLKHMKQFSITRHIHPYLSGFANAAKFNFQAHDYDSAIGNGVNMTIQLEIDTNDSQADKIARNIRVFRLEEIYQGHADIVKELVRKFHISNGEYLKTLHDTFPQIGTKEELYQIAFGNYFNEDDFERRVLAKLTKDIATRLFLLENIHLLFASSS